MFTLEGYTVYKIKLKLYVLIMGYIHNYFFIKLVVIENEGLLIIYHDILNNPCENDRKLEITNKSKKTWKVQ